jgi:hypothetical protein
MICQARDKPWQEKCCTLPYGGGSGWGGDQWLGGGGGGTSGWREGGDGGHWFTDKKESKIFLIYKEIQSGAVAKSYMTNCLLIHIWGNICAFPHILGSPSSYMTLQCSTLKFLIY